MIHILDFILDIIYPRVCGFCGKLNENYLCDECYEKIKQDIGCYIIDTKDKNFDTHIYITKYDGELRKNILNYKFEDKAYMYKTFAKLILKNEKVCRILKSCDIIVAVPIHKKRKDERGYNQSELVAKELAKNIQEIEYKRVLRKIKNNKRQSTLKKEERAENVKNVYEVQNKQIIQDKKIILFDDIYTTGSTADECARVLKENGANEILILTIAR